VTTFKLLGVLLKPDLNFNDHASSVVTVCNQMLYLLPLLRKQRLGIQTKRPKQYEANMIRLVS
jgi:hypothetical protein